MPRLLPGHFFISCGMAYVHGYNDRETQRLLEQSLILEELLHGGTSYASGSRVLEVGCGVGAQTRILLRRNPGIKLTSIDISDHSLQKARSGLEAEGLKGVEFIKADIMQRPFENSSFDHIFVCFVLEHLSEAVEALTIMKDLLVPGGSLTLIEGDHGTGIWTPETRESREAWEGLVVSQRQLGHDPHIGRRLFPLLEEAGLGRINVEPRPIYADRSDPVLLDGVVNKIMHPMVYSAEEYVLEKALVDAETWEKGLADIAGLAEHQQGAIFYSWFKARAKRGKVNFLYQ